MDELELKAAEPSGIPAAEITLDFPAALDPAVGAAILDDESVLLDPATGSSHLLDAPGTLIVQCLDGVSTIGEIADDIADELGLDRATIENDVLTLVRTLGEQGLLQGVLRDEHAGHSHGNEMPMGIPAGSDLSGWAGWAELPTADADTIVVNWGTHCGFCTRIIPELAELEPQLRASGVSLVLVTSGTPEELREQLGDVALPVVHVGSPPEFFSGLGTPVAYVVGPDRQTTEPLSVGAGEVPQLARRLAGQS